jgi:2'-5' RNA ligase
MATIATSDPRTAENVEAPSRRARSSRFARRRSPESLAALGRHVAPLPGEGRVPENAPDLAFVGDIDKSALPVLQSVGDGVPKSGFDVNFDSLGAWRASGVAWIAPSVLPPALQRLHAALAKSLDVTVAPNFTVSPDSFDTSITSARASLSSSSAMHPRWHAELHLVGSELRADGPVYRDLASWDLAAR